MDTARARPVEPGLRAATRTRRAAQRAAVPWLAGALLALWGASVAVADEPPASGAEIELRKSFTTGRGRTFHPSRDPPAGRADRRGATPASSGGIERRQEAVVATALGEPLAASGALHLPLPGGATVVLAGDTTPVLESASGRRVIVDAAGAIDPRTAADIERAWTGYVVARPAGRGLRELIAGVLDVAGYASVETAKPLVFGREARVRVTPDFLIQRSPDDLLHGELRAVSVVDPADALPAELRELAAEHRVRIVELAVDGSLVGHDVAPWRDPTGRITTMQTARVGALTAEIASTLGAATAAAAAPGDDAPAGRAPADAVRDAVGAMLSRLGIAAVGPVVEFHRPSPAGTRGRFAITVPGWLAEHGGRRLLITGAALPLTVRLYLTREGIDIFEYRVVGGRN